MREGDEKVGEMFVGPERHMGVARGGEEIAVEGGGADVFFFQAEDGIRDLTVTGVQTCALPIYSENGAVELRRAASMAYSSFTATQRKFDQVFEGELPLDPGEVATLQSIVAGEIGRASCRERV